MKNPFETLGISKNAVKEFKGKALRSYIENIYRFLAVNLHPDLGGDRKRMQEINGAYSYLKDDSILEAEAENYIRGYSQSAAEKLRKLEGVYDELLGNIVSHLQGKENPKGVKITVDSGYGGVREIEFDSYGKSYEKQNQNNLRVLGVLTEESRQKIVEYKPSDKNPLLASGGNIESRGIPSVMLAKDKFVEIAPFVSSSIIKGGYLITFDGNYYRVEGRIKNIEKKKANSSMEFIGDIGSLVEALEKNDKEELLKVSDSAFKKKNIDLALLACIETRDAEKIEELGDKLKQTDPRHAAFAYLKANNKDKVSEMIDFLAKIKKDYNFAASLCDLIEDEEKKGDVEALRGDLRKAYGIYERILSLTQHEDNIKDSAGAKIRCLIDLLIKKQDYECAYKAANRIENSNKIREIANLASKSGKKSFAIAMYKNRKIAGHKQAGDLYLSQENFEEAFNEYSLGKHSGKKEVTNDDFVRLGDEAFEKKDYEMALKCFSKDKNKKSTKKKIRKIGEIKLEQGKLDEAFKIYRDIHDVKALDIIWQRALENDNIPLLERCYNFLASIDGKTGKKMKKNMWSKRGAIFYLDGGILTSAFKDYLKRRGMEKAKEIAQKFENSGKKNLAIKIYEIIDDWDKISDMHIETGNLEGNDRKSSVQWHYTKSYQALVNQKNSGKNVDDRLKNLADKSLKEDILSVAINSYDVLKDTEGIENTFQRAIAIDNKRIALRAALLTKDPEKIGDAYLLDVKVISNIGNAVKMYKKAGEKAKEKLEKAEALFKQKKAERDDRLKRIFNNEPEEEEKPAEKKE